MTKKKTPTIHVSEDVKKSHEDVCCVNGQCNLRGSRLAVGTVVHLASGSPPMTVTRVLDHEVETVRWCDEAQEFSEGRWPDKAVVPCDFEMWPQDDARCTFPAA